MSGPVCLSLPFRSPVSVHTEKELDSERQRECESESESCAKHTCISILYRSIGKLGTSTATPINLIGGF